MTGMEDDGGKGMLDMKEAGAYTIARDDATSVVFGMSPECPSSRETSTRCILSKRSSEEY